MSDIIDAEPFSYEEVDKEKGKDKIVAWLCDIYLSLLICFGNYGMILIKQLDLSCKKDCVQSPTRKEGCDLFQKTSDDNKLESKTRQWKKQFQKTMKIMTWNNHKSQ